ncbi:MAG: EAL domain-containing protein [Pedobacter sp.]
MNQKFTLKLKVYIYILIAIITLPLICIIAHEHVQDKNLAFEATKRKFLQLSRSTSAKLEKKFLFVRNDLLLLSQIFAGNQYLPSAAWQKIVKEYREAHPCISALILCNPDGTAIFTQPATPNPDNFSDRAYFIEAIKIEKMTSSGLLRGKVTGQPVIAFALPVFTPNNRLKTVLIAGMSLGGFEQAYSESNFPEGTVLRLIDENGETIFTTATNRGSQPKVTSNHYISLLSRDQDAYYFKEEVYEQGVSHVSAIFRLASFPSPTYLTLSIPTSSLYAELNMRTKKHLVGLLVLILGVGTLICFFSKRWILQPLDHLVENFRDIAKGDLTTHATINSSCEEFACLETCFNFMARTLEQRELGMLHFQKQIFALNRLYSVISEFNKVVLRTRNKEDLLKAACQIASTKCGYFLVAAGQKNVETGEVMPLAWSGPGSEYINQSSDIIYKENLDGNGPWESCLRKPGAFFCNDIENSIYSETWRKNAMRHGINSMAVCLLSVDTENDGVLAFYSREKDFFNNEEMELLKDLANDTSMGLEYCHKDGEINRLSHYDPLTGIPNRTLLHNRLQQGLIRTKDSGKHLAIVTVRIDQLDQIAVVHGIENRDLVVKEVVRYLERHLQRADTLARISPSRFVMLFENVEKISDIDERLKRLFDSFPDSPTLEEKNIFVTAKAGVSIAPQNSTDHYILFQNALAALESLANTTGSKYAFFSPEIQAKAQRNHVLEQELRLALKRNELYLHYQPIVDAKTEKIVAAEALMRWESKKLGPVPPSEFIPVAEATNLIVPMGEWLLKTVCQDITKFKKQGLPPLKFSVNLSIDQLCEDTFIERTKSILEKQDYPTKELGLVFELTESKLMENLDKSLEKLNNLRSMGIELSIDDFGTGYSSLSYIENLPASTLKIDRSFIQAALTNYKDFSIVESTIRLAHDLSLVVVAEGVETELQVEFLQRFKCDLLQGYLFGKPGSIDLLVSRLAWCAPTPTPYHVIAH